MEFNPVFPLSLLGVWLMLLNSIPSSSANFPVAKPGCPEFCGDVRIPFPFGIGEGCYLDQHPRFRMECNSSISRLNFPGSRVRIANMSLEGQFRAWTAVGYDCYDEQNQKIYYFGPKIGTSEPFSYNSSANKLTVVGCDSFAFAQGSATQLQNEGTNISRRYNTGCMSTCSKTEDIQDGFCSGNGCCQTSIPNGAMTINITLGSFRNHSLVSSFNPCTYVFIVSNDVFQFYADNFTSLDAVETLPLVMDWVVAFETCEEAWRNISTYACRENSHCYEQEQALGYRCRCNEGYEGNPYLGCQDIDECSNPDKFCPKNSTCTNKVGSYECKCIQGYHSDGGKGCVPDNKKSHWPIFIGIGLGGGTLSLLIFAFCFYSQWMRRKEKRLRDEFFRKNGGLILQQKLNTRQEGGTYSTKIYTYVELQEATHNFDERRIIGRGGFGTVFRGEMINKKIVAIKKSKSVEEHQVEQFINEVILLSQINSRYVVKLLGCCLEAEVPLLVYEYINNGTLSEHLHQNIKAPKLSWTIRLRIASEIAGVLSYLHSVTSPPIIHRDIKSANILLDENFTAKVSDFGISRLVASEDNQVATVVQGTLGYLDPEYMQTGLLTEKSDVYSFGVLLIEIIAGKKVLDFDKPEPEKFLSNVFLASLRDNRLAQFLDRGIFCPEYFEEMREVATIAKRCINVRGEDRPCMKDIERDLEVLGAKSKQISIHVLEIDSTRTETF